MSYKKILLTGASGKLGKIISSKISAEKLLKPGRDELDITDKESVINFFEKNEIDAIIHCAAFTNMKECEDNPSKAITTNLIGTSYLVAEALKAENIRFIYISTDYVYPCIEGPYKEKDPTIPFTVYGWSKLGGECSVRNLKNHCIIRTSFFDPNNIHFDDSPVDVFCSKITIQEVANAVIDLLNKDFIGPINVGCERTSLFEIFRKHKKSIIPTTLEEISKMSNAKRAKDSSLDITLWKSIS